MSSQNRKEHALTYVSTSHDYRKAPGEKTTETSKTRSERAQNSHQTNRSIDQYETHNSFRHQFTNHKVAWVLVAQAAEIKPEHEKLANKSLRTIQ